MSVHMGNATLEKGRKKQSYFCYTLLSFHMQVDFLKIDPPKFFSCFKHGFDYYKYNTLTIFF